MPFITHNLNMPSITHNPNMLFITHIPPQSQSVPTVINSQNDFSYTIIANLDTFNLGTIGQRPHIPVDRLLPHVLPSHFMTQSEPLK
jgi:hypothetical protein